MEGIRLALFDLDETLFAHRSAVRAGIADVLARDFPGVDAAAHQDRWDDLEEHHYARYLTGELDYLGQRRARARGFLSPLGLDLPDDRAAEAWFEDYLAGYRAAWALFDDTLPCLDTLKAAGVRLGIITNGELDFQLAKLDATGLTARFEHIVASGELGITKPDPRIFAHACALFGVPAAEALYVGDRLGTDALGAAASGLSGVWLDRGGTATAAELDAAREGGARVIRSLAELPALARV